MYKLFIFGRGENQWGRVDITTMSEMNLPSMMRKARHALSVQDYGEAAILYTALMGHEDMADNLDIRVRHALCVEKTGHTKQAMKLYQGIVEYYREAHEIGAAANVEQMIASLEAEMKEKQAVLKAKEEAERITLEKKRIKLAEEKAQLEVAKAKAEAEKAQLEVEKARAEAAKTKAAKLEIERLRIERAKEEALVEKRREEKARQERIRREKAKAEEARAERAKARKAKDSLPSEDDDYTATVKMGAFKLSDMDEEDISVFDLSDTKEAQQEKLNFDDTDPHNPRWL